MTNCSNGHQAPAITLRQWLVSNMHSLDWHYFKTAYGNAKNDVPNQLQALFSDDKIGALHAVHQLHSGLCHQGLDVSSASVPAYPYLMYALMSFDDEIKTKLLDLFLDFAMRVCTDDKPQKVHHLHLRTNLLRDRVKFEQFYHHDNADIRTRAYKICAILGIYDKT